MIAHDPSLVILSITIAILGVFTACVMTSNAGLLSISESRTRIVMAAAALGGAIWATNFVGLLAIEAPINLASNPVPLGISALAALFGTAAALFLLPPKQPDAPGRLTLAAFILGIAIAATPYLGLVAIAGRGLQLSWFLTLVCIAFSVQTAGTLAMFLFRPRGVILTLIGSVGLGLLLTAAHYLAAASTAALEETLLTVPPSTTAISGRYLAWAATIMTYLLCSICLSVFVITQFRDEIEE
jgi:diguanylate cyclase